MITWTTTPPDIVGRAERTRITLATYAAEASRRGGRVRDLDSPVMLSLAAGELIADLCHALAAAGIDPRGKILAGWSAYAGENDRRLARALDGSGHPASAVLHYGDQLAGQLGEFHALADEAHDDDHGLAARWVMEAALNSKAVEIVDTAESLLNQVRALTASTESQSR